MLFARNVAVKCGAAGLANFEKRHRRTLTCKAAKEKRDKETKKKTDKSILSFLKPRRTAVPSTVSDSTIHSCRLAPTKDRNPFVSTNSPEAEDHDLSSTPIISHFVKHFRTLVNGLPASIPQALETDKLAIFRSDPKTFFDLATNADELWEMGLNGMFKTALGWGSEHEGDMDEMIKRGKWGLDG